MLEWATYIYFLPWISNWICTHVDLRIGHGQLAATVGPDAGDGDGAEGGSGPGDDKCRGTTSGKEGGGEHLYLHSLL